VATLAFLDQLAAATAADDATTVLIRDCGHPGPRATGRACTTTDISECEDCGQDHTRTCRTCSK